MPEARVIHATNELAVLEEQLTAYLAGELATFTMPVDLRGTPFQIQVWKAVQQIGYGEVSSYGQIAKTLGRPGAARAVGAANGANPVPILVPCHRLVGHNGALISYRGGVAMKRHLLQVEGVLKDTEPGGNTISPVGRTRR
jgi:O-6-methylguanine DNA methyltransferase